MKQKGFHICNLLHYHMFHNAPRGQCSDVKYNKQRQEVCSIAIDARAPLQCPPLQRIENWWKANFSFITLTQPWERNICSTQVH